MTNNWLGILSQFECFPHCSCEVMREGCIICQPYAFWSSISYFIAAILIFWIVKDRKDEELRLWCFSLVIVSIGSFFAHASYTKLAMAMDFASILNLHLLFMMRRFVWKKMPKVSAYLWVIGILVVLVALLYYLGRWEQTFVALAIFAVCATELLSRVKIRLHKRDRYFFYCFTLMFVMYWLFLLDETEWLCSRSPIPPHTVWHIGSGVCAVFFSRWYFKDRLDIGA
jgi:hypothetical protein